MNEPSSIRILSRLVGLAFLGFVQLAPGQPAGNWAPVHNVDGSFVRDWLVLGPFPSRDMEIDFLASAGGEANVRPKEGDPFVTQDGRRLVWTRFRSQHDLLDFEAVLGVQEWCVAYAYCELNADKSMDTDVRCLSSHPSPVWINGQRVGQTQATPPRRDESMPVLPIHLQAGRNPCLLKVKMETKECWAVSFQPLPPARATVAVQVTDPLGHPVAGARVQLYDQGEPVVRFLQTDAAGNAAICLYPVAKTYDLRVTAGELGAWRYAVTVDPGGRRKLDVELTKAVSISGRTLTMNGLPQTAIVVQALRVPDGAGSDPTNQPPRPRLPDATSEPQINSTHEIDSGTQATGGAEDIGKVRSLLPMPPFSETVLSDTNGDFRFVNLRPGRYRLRAHGAHGYVYPAGERGPDPSPAIRVEPGRTQGGARFVFAEAKQGVWTRYPVRQGLADLHCGNILRTPDGMLWVGTLERTLHAFDGVEFKVFSSPARSANYFHVVEADTKGTIWIGTDAGISRLTAGRIQTETFSDTLPVKVVNSIEPGSGGTMWFGTASGLCRYDGKQFVRWTLKQGLPSYPIGALMRARDGALWMSTIHSLARFDGHRFSEPVRLPGHRLPTAERLHQARDGSLWFCSPECESAVYRYDGKTLGRLGEAEGLPSEKIYQIAETSDGVLWFGTPEGLSRFDGTTILNYTRADGLHDSQVRDIFVDSDDVLWCACNSGVYRFDPKSFQGITLRDGLTNRAGATPGVFAIEPDTGGGYLIGTEWGGVYHLAGRDFQLATNSVLLPDAYVRCIHRAVDGTLWFGTTDGIYHQVGGRVRRVLERDWIIALTRDDQGQLWFGQGWRGGGVSRFNPRTGLETVFTRADGLPDDSVWALERGPDGGVWIGTGAGLALFRAGKIEPAGQQLGIPPEMIMSLRRDAAGTLWIGSELGLRRLQGTNVISLTSTNSAPVQGVWCGICTTDGLVWIGTDKNGLLGYDGRAVTQIDKRDGLLGNQIFTLRAAGNDSLLVGSIDGGLARYQRTKTPPSVRFMEVKLEDQTLSDFSNLPSTETGKRVSVRYQEIDLKTLPDKRQFQYRVTGPSGKLLFSGITRERRFEWTPRQGGNYTFEVQAIDRDLNYSKPVRLNIRATVPWYANAWILAPSGAGIIALIVFAGVSGWRSHVNRRETIRLREQMLEQERQARASLEQSNRALDVASRAKSMFLANMSHEIRTPLNAVLGFAQILHRDRSLGLDQRRSVGNIERSADHLLTLINEILDLSKIESGHMELREAEFDLADLVRSVSAMFELRCREKGLEWQVAWEIEPELETSVDGPADDPVLALLLARSRLPVRGDPGKLRQVLINILGNAVKFTDRGQVAFRVTGCRAAPSPPDPRESPGPPPALFTFEIEDTGPGISEATREKIFDSFVQGEEGLRKGGTGLGLAIARRHIELMGGKLRIESEIGRGTRFVLTLHLTRVSGDATAISGPPLQGEKRLRPGTQVRALVADDVAENREVLRRFLEELGASVVEREDGTQALEELHTGRFDIAFLDIRMAGLTGLEVVERYLTEAGADRTRLVAISASVLLHERTACTQKGFDAFLPKPFHHDELCACLGSQLGVVFECDGNGPEMADAVHRHAPARDPGGSPIDWARLRSLFGKDAAGERALLEKYLGTTSELFATLRQALLAADLAKVESLAHRCRGTSVNFGIRAMVLPMDRLESAASAGNRAECELALVEAEGTFRFVEKILVERIRA